MKRIRVLLLAMSLANARVAFADGGAVRISEARGDLQITVFTSPTPLVVGDADVSVLVLEMRSGRPVTDLPIEVAVTQGAASLGDITVAERRSTFASTNKLVQAASVAFPQPGVWGVEVSVKGLDPLRFDVDVGEPPPPWREMSLWIGWPLLVIVAFAVRQVFVRSA